MRINKRSSCDFHFQNDEAYMNDFVADFDVRFFKTLSEPVRVDLLKFLMLNGRSDIGTIADHMPQDRSVVSRHLNLMHTAGILTCRKETRYVYYEINGKAFIDKLREFTCKLAKCLDVSCLDDCK